MFRESVPSTIKAQPTIPPVPRQTLEYNHEKAQNWIDAESDPDIRDIKRKILEHIQHISFTEFKEKSAEVVSGAVQELKRQGHPYAVLFDYKPHSSKRWVYEINKECYTEYPPAEASYFTPAWEKMSGNARLRDMVAKGIHAFFISDDAAYSGEQIMNRQILPILRFYAGEGIAQRPEFTLAVPFVTSRFIKLVRDTQAQYGCTIQLHSKTVMPTLSEILTDDEKVLLQERREGGLNIDETAPSYLGATITYFDHRVADDHSFSGEVKATLNLSAEKPYSNEDSKYFAAETQEFNAYQQLVHPE